MVFRFKKNPKLYRHGDLLIKRVDQIPVNAISLSTNIIAHGENGNTHQLHGSHQVFETPDKQMYFQANQEISLEHQEHDTLKISKGKFVILRERAHNPFKDIQEEVLD